MPTSEPAPARTLVRVDRVPYLSSSTSKGRTRDSGSRLALSQSTLSPATSPSPTADENVSASTAFELSTTSSSCSALNTSACAACAPGTRADNAPPVTTFSLLLSHINRLPYVQTLIIPPVHTALWGAVSAWPVLRAPTATAAAPSRAPAVRQPSETAGDRRHLMCTVTIFSPPVSHHSASNCTSCQVCSPGSESLQVAAKECTPCRPGMYRTAVQNLCQICSSGFFQVRWGQESCDICPENHYCPSPDVNPVLCPDDAFCPEGSTSPGYCMETFLRKVGHRCELAPVTIALLVIAGGAAFLFVVVLLLRRRRDVDRELSPSRTPLLRKERLPAQFYGAEPVYAGW
ncbi:laminin subunit alpha-2-like [Scleropages formosus]|uniref:Laminin subunit alpha-2-like n=1 Tax=Scleropages formosus TaxID=113540 RepID=A0A0P7X3X8_SCLFO|nr:laminin subunit alpha-2-like [Scleropages formosus]